MVAAWCCFGAGLLAWFCFLVGAGAGAARLLGAALPAFPASLPAGCCWLLAGCRVLCVLLLLLLAAASAGWIMMDCWAPRPIRECPPPCCCDAATLRHWAR